MPGVLVPDHPLTVAYCVPGLRSHVVVSSGALATLRPDEVAAVLARERHDLVLLPFLVFRPLCRFAAPRSLATALAGRPRGTDAGVDPAEFSGAVTSYDP